MRRGRFVVVEGAEGVGKTTQVRRLVRFLQGRGLAVTATREPGGTAVGESARAVLLDRSLDPVPPEAELLLVMAARAAFVREVVEPALASGRWVVSDRFDMSSFAYQGHGRGLDAASIAGVNDFATMGVTPDLYIVLDLPPGAGAARQQRAGKEPDRFESEGDGFVQRVRRGYLELARSMDRAVLVGAEGTPDEVEARVRRPVVERLLEPSEGPGTAPAPAHHDTGMEE